VKTVRNILISIGAFWLSVLFVAPFDRMFSKMTDWIMFENGPFFKTELGIMSSLGSAFAAMIGGSIATLTVDARKPQLWAVAIALLYVVNTLLQIQPTTWIREWLSANLLIPTLACMGAAFLISRYGHILGEAFRRPKRVE
jgi:hypothetical protein